MDAPRVLAFACLEAGLVLVGLTLGLPWMKGDTELGHPEYGMWTYQDGSFSASYWADAGSVVEEGRYTMAVAGPFVALGLALSLLGSVLILLRKGKPGALVNAGGVLLVALGATLLMVGARSSSKAVGGDYSWGASVYVWISGTVLLVAASVLGWFVKPAPPKRREPAKKGPLVFRMTQPPPAKSFALDPPEPGKPRPPT